MIPISGSRNAPSGSEAEGIIRRGTAPTRRSPPPRPEDMTPPGGRPMPSAMQAQDKGRYPRKQRGVPGNQPGGGGEFGMHGRRMFT